MTKDEYYLKIAEAVASKSPCLIKHYGAVIVKDDIIIATGYNGPARGENTAKNAQNALMVKTMKPIFHTQLFMQNKMLLLQQRENR